MAKTFDPSRLSAADQAAFSGWQQNAGQYLQGGALPAELSYTLNHPEYLQSHPELQDAYDAITGASLPPSVRQAMQQQLGSNINPTWGAGGANFAKHGGVWSQPETWVQLALGAGLGGAAAAGALGAGGAAAGGGASTTAAGAAAPSSIGAVTTGLGGASGTTAAGAAGTAARLAKFAKTAGAVGEVAGGAAGAAAKGRADEASILDAYYRAKLLGAQQAHQAGISDAELQLEQSKQSEAVRQQAIRNALFGGLAQGAQDVQINVPDHLKSHVGTITGGLRPSAFVGLQDLGKRVQDQANTTINTPPTFQTPAPYVPPTAPDMPSTSKAAQFLNYAGLIGSLAGAYGGYKKPQTQPQ